jgi:hypothetical protein
VPLSIQVPGYRLESINKKDNFLIHYNAYDNRDNPCIVTEYFPSYMVSHNENGNVDVVPRFAGEYSTTLIKFINMANAMMTMRDASSTPIEDVIESNNTAYAIRMVNDLPTVSTYMNGKSMETAEAFLFIRPLFLFLAAAQKNECLYKLSESDLRVNRYGQLVLDSMFIWDSNYQSTIMDLAKLYFQLITGAAFDPAKPNPEDYGITLPPRLNVMLKEILDGDILYGSIDDFFKKFKSVVDLETDDDDDEASGRHSSAFLKWIAAGLTTFFIVALALLVNMLLLPLYRDLHLDMANPHFIHAPLPNIPGDQRVHDFFAVAFTNPRNGGDVLDGTFAEHNGTLLMRGYNNGYCLLIREPGREERMLVQNVRPSFMVANDTHVYFTDGLTGQSIYQADLTSGQTRPISPNCALYLVLDGDYLYYTNHDDMDRLYRINLHTLQDELFIKNAAFENMVVDGRLIFTDGNRDFVMTAVSIDEALTDPVFYQLTTTNNANLRLHNDLIYYLDNTAIRKKTTNGQQVTFNCPLPAYSFHPIDDWLIIIHADTRALSAYHTESGRQVDLSTQFRFAYVWAHGDTVYAVDAHDSRVVHEFRLP